ncbi:MAG: helix-turn-helix transcriptional regulator [Anaerolineaceae bacterium]|nr:helix-turn-helix transcriptional regulator [Anaerolineaceae bacterium]
MDSRLLTIKAKKIGLFLRQARENRHLSVEDCANWLGITADEYASVESGELLLSLPQIESLALFLDCSFTSLVEGNSSPAQPKPDSTTNQELLSLRDRIIAVALKQHRLAQSLSVADLAASAGISTAELTGYEEELQAIPYLHLEALLSALRVSTDEFFAQSGPLSLQHLSSQSTPTPESTPSSQATPSPVLEGLSEDMLAFVSKPVNRPYLELAMRLSKMEADKLRAIASSLLEITY